ncbi:unnamed protein product [Adineta steineri]|uniref:Uncharacterized protein n=1 Tax=Adineta steineri TaxID=433720 RepID=A0A816AG05_9BILA|nr:unnamed protein product [Adineta steineri]CAF1595122.1 unnamed protein product [Adineta steineri]
MAKKTKDTTASTAKSEAKTRAIDPHATKDLVRLLNILVLLLAITAFLLQFFAVITHHWKRQVTYLDPVVDSHQNPSNVYDDSRIDQTYGLYSRDVKVYAGHDEQLDVWTSTRFPRLDNGEDDLNHCLSETSTLRGALLTCADRLISPRECHCRRYPHWNAIIFFEVTALILLGLVLLIVSLLTTKFHGLLKPIGVVLSFIAFLFLLIGLIILLSYLKRETRTVADSYPHIHKQIATQVGKRYTSGHHSIVRRQAHETYRAYSLLPGQHPFNETHFQQYSESDGRWVQYPYSSLRNEAYAPRSSNQQTTTPKPAYNIYGPVVGYNTVYENTRACIGWSAVLSILAMIIALLLPLILALSWIKAKTIGPEVKTITTTTVKTEFLPTPHDVTVETVPLTRPVQTEIHRQGPYDNYGGRPETIVRDVVIRDDHPIATQTYRT